MIRLQFTEEEIEALRYEHFHYPHPRVQMKMAAVQLTAHGWSRGEVAEVLGCDEATVRSYVKDYRDGGIEALKRFAVGGRTSELDAHCDSLMKEFDQHPPRNVREAQHRIETLTGLHRSPSQIRAFLKRSGLKYQKVAPIPAKADATVQETFINEQLDPILKEAQDGKRHVFFVDAAHFVFAAFLGYLWCRLRQFLPTPSGRQRFNVLGALHAISHEVVTITNTKYINSGSVVELLESIQKQFSDLPITLILDNAAYQRWALVQAKAQELGIQLLFLPPYSPNLNLIERLWKFVKAESLNAVYYETFPAFCDAITQCLQQTATAHKDRLDTLLTLKFQRFPSADDKEKNDGLAG